MDKHGVCGASHVWIAALASTVLGCSTMPESVSQPLHVETPNCANALCVLTNDKGSWIVNPTPGDVHVMTSTLPLEVVCRARDQSFETNLPSMPEGSARAEGMFGSGRKRSAGASASCSDDGIQVIHVSAGPEVNSTLTLAIRFELRASHDAS